MDVVATQWVIILILLILAIVFYAQRNAEREYKEIVINRLSKTIAELNTYKEYFKQLIINAARRD